jgi:hypothetical protein
MVLTQVCQGFGGRLIDLVAATSVTTELVEAKSYTVVCYGVVALHN